MESHCLSGALHVVIKLNTILKFCWTSAPLVMKRHKLQPGFVCLTFLAFYIPWRCVSTPDYKAPPASFLFPLWPRQIASSALPGCVYTDSPLCGVWVWNGTQISQLSSVAFDIALISCCILHTMKSLLMKLLSPLSLPPALHKAHPTQLKIRTYKICIFFQGWHITVFCYGSSILCYALLCFK